jgi:hypothetical protein
MPSDIPFQSVNVVETAAPRRLPVGMGLAIGAGASLALWGAIAMGLRALFF